MLIIISSLLVVCFLSGFRRSSVVSLRQRERVVNCFWRVLSGPNISCFTPTWEKTVNTFHSSSPSQTKPRTFAACQQINARLKRHTPENDPAAPWMHHAIGVKTPSALFPHFFYFPSLFIVHSPWMIAVTQTAQPAQNTNRLIMGSYWSSLESLCGERRRKWRTDVDVDSIYRGNKKRCRHGMF